MTVERLHELTPNVPGYYRLGCFNRLPSSAQQRILEDLEQRARFLTERQRRGAEVPEWELDTKHVLYKRRKAATPTKPYRPAPEDNLDVISAEIYVQAITGQQVEPTRHGYIRCPLPDHSDSSPSFKVYPDSWHCFSCNRGGSIYDFAGHYWGYSFPLRGDNFKQVKGRLRGLFA
jgi:hypothetical protein